MRRHLARGQTVVDVGAHRGAFTYWMLRAVGPGGRVVAVEPIPWLAADLRCLAGGANAGRLRVVEAVLSSAAGTATLHIPDAGGLGTATVLARTAGHTPLPVAATTLDALCGGPARRPVGFVKCDVEGHELEVLRGAERVLREDRPALLVEAVDDRPAAGQTGRVFDYLRGLGYRGWFFVDGRTRPIEEFRADRDQAMPGVAWCVNFGFLPADGNGAGS